MKRFIFLTILLSQQAFGVTLLKSAFVFDVYREKIPVIELQDGDEIQIIDENQKIQEAEIFNFSLNDQTVSFDILGYENKDVVSSIETRRSSNKYTRSQINIRKFMIPVALLAASALPVVAGLPVGWCNFSCVALCRVACAAGPLAFPAMAPFCFAVEAAGTCEAGCTTATFLLPC